MTEQPLIGRAFNVRHCDEYETGYPCADSRRLKSVGA
jgi:hypothetical protein